MFNRPYIINLSEEAAKIRRCKYGPFDSSGVPLVDYNKLYAAHGILSKRRLFPITYTPVTIAQYALGLWTSVVKNDREARTNFMIQSDWLTEHLEKRKPSFWVWVHRFPMPMYRLDSDWVSAMAQGEGISVLTRAYHLTKDEKYLNCAFKAFTAFEHNISQGGVSYIDSDGSIWFEEYPHQPPAHVLNGMISAMFGLYDLSFLTGDKKVSQLFQQSVKTLLRNIANFDCRFGSLYDLYHRQLAGQKYHNLHIRQLSALYKLTGRKKFKRYADLWQQYDASNWKRFQRRWRPKLSIPYWRLKLNLWQLI